MRCVFIYVLPHRLARLLQAAVYNDDARHILATMPPWRRRGERETTTSSWLSLECNHIWYSSSFWKDKPSSSNSSLVGLLSKSEIQIGLPFILAKNYTSLRKTMLEIIHWKMATRKGLWKWLLVFAWGSQFLCLLQFNIWQFRLFCWFVSDKQKKCSGLQKTIYPPPPPESSPTLPFYWSFQLAA